MSETRCATCGHWDAPGPGDNGYGTCQQINGRDDKAAWVNALAGFADSCNGELLTRADFGCALHEEREEAP